MKYRNATSKDSEGIANVLKRSYNIDSIDEGRNIFENETKKNHQFVVVEDNGKIVGIATWISHGLYKHGLAELDRIAVLPDYQGKGIAKELFAFLLKDVKNVYEKKGSKLRKLYILTHKSNKRAQEFYKKIGCIHETTLKDHYYKDVDEFVFSIFF